jgi:GT2 family glycosyltransferase
VGIGQKLKRFARRIPGAMTGYQKLQDVRRSRAVSGRKSPGWTLEQVRAFTADMADKNLRFFLDTNQSWAFPSSHRPAVSVIIPVFNRASLTLQCLEALSSEAAVGLEVIIIDNASSDETADLFARLKDIQYVRNQENVHFLEASNQGAALAKGASLLFLNSDTRVLPGTILSALETLTSSPTNGAVGARLILPDGSLQEAGSMIWGDGTCFGYGRGDNPDRAPYQFRRPVDYCSAAFLLTPRALFESFGGFDRDFRPAYYEEVDYCLRLWERGYRVIYDPRAVVWHFEFASSKRSEDALRLQRERRTLIVRKHSDLISQKLAPAPAHVLLNRSPKHLERRRVLWIDERIPHSRYGAGYPRAREIVTCLDESECDVTLYPAVFEEQGESWKKIYGALPRSVEVAALAGYGPSGLRRFLRDRKGYYDLYFVSRPDTMRSIRALLETEPSLIPLSSVIYDAEALFSNRERLETALAGKAMTDLEYERRVARELSLARGVRRIMTVSAQEAAICREHGFDDISIVGHAVAVNRPVKTFRERSGILFVAAIHGDGGPNYDAAQWFCKEILPLLRARGIHDVFYIVGYHRANGLHQHKHLGVEIVGEVDELRQWYERCKIFVAPTRFSAGIPLKVIEALANGLPVVATTLLVNQLGWSPHEPVLCADAAADFARLVTDLANDERLWTRLSHASVDRVATEFSRTKMRQELGKIIGFDAVQSRSQLVER